MPRNPRRPDEPSTAGGVLRDLFGELFDFVGTRVQEAAPRCGLCDEIAIPLRCPCGGFGCKDHGYFNLPLGRAICPMCAMQLGAAVMPEGDVAEEFEEVFAPKHDQARRRRAARRRRRPQTTEPSFEAVSIAWETLGLDPTTSTVNDVNKAFRQAARDCHPDLHPGDASAERKFKGVRRATELCLADLASRQEE